MARSRVKSLGVGPDVSWDICIAERGLRVLQFDHALSRSPQDNPRFIFHKSRVVGREEAPDDITLARILERADLAGDNELIVKIDIEGSEWDVLAHSTKETLGRMRQIAIEFHGLHEFIKPDWRSRAIAVLKNLMATHACIHLHGNNWAPFLVIGGIPFPSVFEATFARRDNYALSPSTAVFPMEIDKPNNPKVPDLYLGRWTY